MNINEVLDTAIRLEEKLSLLYQEIGHLCHDKSMSEELIRLSAEEIAHKNLLITGKNYINATGAIIILKSDTITNLRLGLRNLSTTINRIQNRKLNIISALNDATKLEKAFAQYHFKLIDDVEDMSLKRLFEILSACDTAHEERIQKIYIRPQQQDKISAPSLS